MVGCCEYGMNVHVQSSAGNFLTSRGTFFFPLSRGTLLHGVNWVDKKKLYFCLKWFVSSHYQTENLMKVSEWPFPYFSNNTLVSFAYF